MNKSLRTILQYVFFFGLGIFLIWWSIRGLTDDHKAHIRDSVREANYLLMIPVFGIMILAHLFRAIRWRLLIQPLGYNPSVLNTFFAVMIGYLTNQALPRLGEFLRCTFLFRYEKVPVDKLIGTVILERIIDLLCLLLVFGITLYLQPGIYSDLMNAFFNSGAEGKLQDANKLAGWVIGLITFGVVLVIVVLWMLIKKKTLADVIDLVKQILLRIWNGIGTIQHLKRRWEFLFLTFSIWFLYFIGGYIGFYALKETMQYGVPEAFSILSAGSVGMVATPGGIGAYALLVQKTMQVYGLNEGTALAFGWLIWLAQTAVILIGGFTSFMLMPYLNKKK